jgi:hypothetical protein
MKMSQKGTSTKETRKALNSFSFNPSSSYNLTHGRTSLIFNFPQLYTRNNDDASVNEAGNSSDDLGLITWLPRIPITNSSFQSAVLFESVYEAGNSSEEDPKLDNLATSNSSYQL